MTFLLMSIYPKYADLIYRGEKNWEFRKASMPLDASVQSDDTSKIYLYETAPVSKVTGWMTVDYSISNSPDKLWETLKGCKPGVSKSEYQTYYHCADRAHAWHIRNVFQLPVPPALKVRPPMSYRRIELDMLEWK